MDQAQPEQDSEATTLPDVIVRAPREPDVPPLAILGPEQIAIYGADSLTELLSAITPLTGSGPGAEGPIVLINGRRISGPADLTTLPPEALRQAEIYPAEKALRLGYPPNRKVINFVLAEKFRAYKVNLADGTATEGGAGTRAASLAYSRIDQTRRITLGLDYKGLDSLLESERDVIPPASPPYSFAGTLVDASGADIGFAHGPDGNLAATRTLRGASDNLNLTAWIADRIGGASVSLTGTLTSTWTRSMQGPALAALSIPATNPFSDLGRDVTLYRYLAETRPLEQTGHTLASSIGLAVDGSLGKWHWNVTGRYNRSQSDSIIDRSVDTSRLQAAILAGDPAVDPFAPVSPYVLGTRLADRGSSTSNIGTFTAMLLGPVARLPAGNAFANLSVFGVANGAAATTTRADGVLTTGQSQDTETAVVRLILPLTSKGANILPWAGNISANLSAGATRLSRYGMLKTIGYGGSWSVASGLQFSLAIDDQEGAPPIDQLVAPTVQVPNVPVFDYRSGTSVLVTSITGGNPDLKENHRHSFTAGVTLTPFSNRNVRVSANYVESTLRDPVYPLPAATPAIEAAFPERFVRGADGTLLSIDTRPVNVTRADQAQWNATLSFSFPSNISPMLASSDSTTTEKQDKSSNKNSIAVDLTQIWRLRDSVQLRPDLPRLDLLDGNAIVASGGQPRHEVSLNIHAAVRGIGLGVEGQWKSGTRVVGGDPTSNLTFSDLATVNTRLFASLGSFSSFKDRPWAKNMRISLEVTNLFDSHVDVRDGNGKVPILYQPGYLDPVGRLVSLSLRKLI
jgi:hypothetical protein